MVEFTGGCICVIFVFFFPIYFVLVTMFPLPLSREDLQSALFFKFSNIQINQFSVLSRKMSISQDLKFQSELLIIVFSNSTGFFSAFYSSIFV